VLKRGVNDTQHTWAVEEASKIAEDQDFLKYILSHCTDDQLESVLPHLARRRLWKPIRLVLERGVSTDMLVLAVSEACKCWTYTTVMWVIKKMLGFSTAQLLIKSLTSTQLPPDAQSVALRFALQQNRWDVISQECLSQVWEQVRRELFRAVLEQRLWRVVKQRADHTLYLDPRWWALQEAYKH
jgi:hypothetical protein